MSVLLSFCPIAFTNHSRSPSPTSNGVSTKMASEGGRSDSNVAEGSLQLSFPLPPVKYFCKYTDENLAAGLAPAPPSVITGSYSSFGDSYDANEDIIRPLEAQGIPRLYPTDENIDILAEMKKINHSILVSFLELLDTLIDAPSQEERQLKLDDMNMLFINLHHLINEFRPHQARETLRVMLHRQRTQRLETAEKLARHVEKAKASFRNCQSAVFSKMPLHTGQQQQQQIKQEPIPNSVSNHHEKGDGTVHRESDGSDSQKTNLKLMCDIVDQIT